MSFLLGLLEGATESIEERKKQKIKQAETEAEAAKERGKELLKGIIEGNIEQTERPEEAIITEPGQVIKRGLFGLGKPTQTTPARYYKRGKPKTQPIVDKQGNIIGYRPEGSVFQPSEGFSIPSPETASSLPALPPAPTGRFNPLRMLQGYASYGEDKRSAYNALRERGISVEEAKRRLGLE